MRNGIALAGSLIVDHIYPITGLPKPGELTTILDGIGSATGGLVPNVAVDLAKLDPTLPLQAIGAIGNDMEGKLLLDTLSSYPNIDLSGIVTMSQTSFTAVMADTVSKQRTFFAYHGASGLFSEEQIDWDNIHAKILHAGYILLLDSLDLPDEEYGTKMARLLSHAQERGIKTSIDIVSEMGDRMKKLVPPALRYTDYCIVNETETQKTTGIPLRDDSGKLKLENMKDALDTLFKMGVREWAVIHFPEGGCGMDAAGNYIEADALPMPRRDIKGTVGAGDAFCSGVLYGAHQGMELRNAINLGTGCASCSLTSKSATEACRSLEETRAFCKSYLPDFTF